MARSNNTDLVYTDAHRSKAWRSGQCRPYKGEMLSSAEIAKLAGCSVTEARRRCITQNMDPAKLIEKWKKKRADKEPSQ